MINYTADDILRVDDLMIICKRQGYMQSHREGERSIIIIIHILISSVAWCSLKWRYSNTIVYRIYQALSGSQYGINEDIPLKVSF